MYSMTYACRMEAFKCDDKVVFVGSLPAHESEPLRIMMFMDITETR